MMKGNIHAVFRTLWDKLTSRQLYLSIESIISHKAKSPNIQILDAGAIFNILSKASCFAKNINVQAAQIREIRNNWAHCIVQKWNDAEMNKAFSEMKALANMIPGMSSLLAELDDHQKGQILSDFPMKEALLKISKYRSSVKNGKHKKQVLNIRKLSNSANKEIFVKRKFMEVSTGYESSKIEELMLKNETVLLHGSAGAGKSAVAAKTFQLFYNTIPLKRQDISRMKHEDLYQTLHNILI